MPSNELRATLPQGEGGQTAASLLYDRIRADIIRGEFAPGVKLKVADLAKFYGAGAIPVREALSRLATSGFVDAKDQRGFAVRNVSPEELQDLTRVRLFVESAVLRDAIQNGDVAWEGRVLSAFHRMSKYRVFSDPATGKIDAEWEAAHDNFHKQLISGSVSPWLIKLADELRDQTTRYRHISARARKSSSRDVCGEHRAILDAVLARKEDLAVALLGEHISTSTAMALSEELEPDAESARPRALTGSLVRPANRTPTGKSADIRLPGVA